MWCIGVNISVCSGGGHVMQAWLHHCDWLKARTHDSIWANDSLPRTFSGKEMHSAKTILWPINLSSLVLERAKNEGNTKENRANRQRTKTPITLFKHLDPAMLEVSESTGLPNYSSQLSPRVLPSPPTPASFLASANLSWGSIACKQVSNK